MADGIPVDFGHPNAFFRRVDDLAFGFEFLIVDGYAKPIQEPEPESSKVFNGADAVQPHPTERVGIVEIGVD